MQLTYSRAFGDCPPERLPLRLERRHRGDLSARPRPRGARSRARLGPVSRIMPIMSRRRMSCAAGSGWASHPRRC